MPLNLASPGIVVREVDLTLGRVDPTSDKVAAVVAPFSQGPVEVPTLVENESDLLANFGKSYSTDRHYEHWMVASSFLSYGGSLRVVRADNSDLKNAFVGLGTTAPKIKSLDHYNQLGYDENTIQNVTIAARNPGTWGNGIKVAVIDGYADQVITGISTAAISVGFGITQTVADGTVIAGAGSTSLLDGYFKGVVTSVGSSEITVKFVQHVSAAGVITQKDYQENGIYRFSATTASNTQIINNSGVGVQTVTTGLTPTDWFDSQEIVLTGDNINWNSLASRPGTSAYAEGRDSRFDEVHVVVIDDDGDITGNPGSIMEKHLNLSKATDAAFANGSISYWREYIKSSSGYIFAGGEPTGSVVTDFKTGGSVGNGFVKQSDVDWDQAAKGIAFAANGNSTYTLANGTDYGGKGSIDETGALAASISNLSAAYETLENPDEYAIDFILQGSGNYSKEAAQAVALKAIDIASRRRDSIAFISPYRGAIFTDNATESVVRSAETITDNVIGHFSSITSSSFAVFDSGYKYTYDRFSDKFRYVPLNGDVAGTCARTDINAFPWFSPAGTARGAILNAIKLPYNPSKSQRDRLYSNRINPVTFIPGSGIILYGDKTGLAKSSAFDRINVRRLFLYLEKAISSVARDQLFEFNDEITRSNFVNAVEPFLREVQSNRGVEEFVVRCDETNNTAAVIDRNEFVADIFVKPARSINFVGLTFVATRTGVSFEEIIGNV